MTSGYQAVVSSSWSSYQLGDGATLKKPRGSVVSPWGLSGCVRISIIPLSRWSNLQWIIRNENKQREDSFVDLDKLRKKLAMMGLGRMTSFWIRGISFTTLSNSWSTRRRCCGTVGGVGDVGESGIQGFSRCWETSIPFGELVSVIL